MIPNCFLRYNMVHEDINVDSMLKFVNGVLHMLSKGCVEAWLLKILKGPLIHITLWNGNRPTIVEYLYNFCHLHARRSTCGI